MTAEDESYHADGICGMANELGVHIVAVQVGDGRVDLADNDNVFVHEGTLKTLKRFKDEVREINQGYECGMAFENYQDIQAGDVIECFEVEEIARAL